jgi:hypothetical protein
MKSTTPIEITVAQVTVVIAELNGGEMYRHNMGIEKFDDDDEFTSVPFAKGWTTEEDAQAMADKITTAVENGRGDREMLEWERQHEDY